MTELDEAMLFDQSDLESLGKKMTEIREEIDFLDKLKFRADANFTKTQKKYFDVKKYLDENRDLQTT